MVENKDVQQEFDLFSDIWKVFKALLPVGNRDDVEYWDRAVNDTTGIMQKYPGEFGKALSLVILDELGRRCKEHENINAGCETVS